MRQIDIRNLRLQNQHLLSSKYTNPVDVVRSLVAVQAQDYPGAKWGLGMRMLDASDAVVEDAVNDGRILRLHIMRPTWHFVTAEDIRWLLKLTAPRVKAVSASYLRKAGLDDAFCKRTNKTLSKALRGGQHLTRDELRQAMTRAGIEPGDSIRLGHIMLCAELDGVVCSGARRRNQFTYALLDERVPVAKTLERDEALGELALRYFRSRGPATQQDYCWWSGLTASEAKRGIEIMNDKLRSEVVEGKTYWLAKSTQTGTQKSPKRRAHLLPAYDEYFIAYKDRGAAIPAEFDQKSIALRVAFDAPFVIDGRVFGSWKRIFEKNVVKLQFETFLSVSKADRALVMRETRKYGDFLGNDVCVEGLV
jgi:hypothetical protein